MSGLNTKEIRFGAHFWALAGFGLLALSLSWPLAAHLPTELPAPPVRPEGSGFFERADLDLLVWILAWTARSVVLAPFELFDANISHPARNALASSEHLIGMTPLATPLWFATRNPILTYNLTALGVSVITAFSLWLAVIEEEKAPVAAFVVAALFAFDPNISLVWVRLHESAIWLFPLVLLLALRVARNPSGPGFAMLVLVTAIQFLAGAYLTFILAIFLVALSPALVLEARKYGRSGLLPLLALACGALLAAPSALPYLDSANPPGSSLERILASGARLSFTDSIQRLFEGSGVLLFPLATLGLVFGRAPRSLRFCLAGAVLCGALLAMGPQGSLIPGTDLPSLYRLLMDTIPGFGTMRAPVRFLVVSRLAVALLAGFGLSFALRGSQSWRSGIQKIMLPTAIAVLFAIQPAWPLSLTGLLRAPYTTGAHSWLAENGVDGAVLDLPPTTQVGDRQRETGLAMLGATEHWLPLLNGYSGYQPPSFWMLMSVASQLPDPAAFETLCRFTDLRWIVAHFGRMDKSEAAFVNQLPIVERARFGRDVLFEARVGCGREKERLLAQMEIPKPESLDGLPTTELPLRDRHSDIVVVPLGASEGGTFRRALVTVTNTSTKSWPGLDIERAGRVELAARLRLEDGTVIKDYHMPLGRDLAPGQSLTLEFAAPGAIPWATSAVEFGLRQRGFGWFADRGGSGIERFLLGPDVAG
ncbi:MAG: hypothetical protein P8K76_13565 [Candidatus Binatia bacterium]|nr:hypothetical protein [Candidatus Binatia bacterium]MDG2010797.1 hypothetical protein [Candidatus Binatia bacterium]